MKKDNKKENINQENPELNQEKVEQENTLENETTETEETVSETESLKEELSKEQDRYVRLYAEFENYKRRTGRERVELFATAGREVMESLLPVLDDFERALAEIKKSDDSDHLKGVELIYNKMKEALKKQGLESMNVKAGDAFDADLHEAVTQIPAPSKKLKGKIVDVIQRGYTLGDKIIRYPKVVTGA